MSDDVTPTPPDAEAVARAERELDAAAVALAKGVNATMADSERYVNARNAYREAVERRVRSEQAEYKAMWQQAEESCGIYAKDWEHNRECAAFVAALDAGEILQFSGWGKAADPSKFGIRLRTAGPMDFGFGPDVLTAFRAAQDHLGGGDGTL